MLHKVFTAAWVEVENVAHSSLGGVEGTDNE